MTPLRRHAVLRRVKDISLGTTLSLTLLTNTVTLQSCGSNQSEENERTETSFGRGVRTYITETAPGNFKITDETPAGPGQAGAIVSYYDGHRDTLNVEAAQRLVQNDQSTRTYLNNPAQYGGYHHNGLANALLWGSLGYMLGRRSGPQYSQYEQRYGSGFYANRGVYERSARLGSEVSRSRVVRTVRPSGGRSGFFGGRFGRSFLG